MLRKYVVMLSTYVIVLPLNEHALTGLIFGRVRHLRNYVFDMHGCFSSIYLRKCLLRY